MNRLIKRGIVFILVFFAVGELAIRTSDALKGDNFFSNEQNRLSAKNGNPIIPFTVFGPHFYTKKDGVKYISSTHNELYPLIKPKNTFRIVCMGESTTENDVAYRDYKMHYPLELQRMLQQKYPDKNIEVINTSYAAYSSAHLLVLLLLDVISWNPDLVVISENINDLDAAYWDDLNFDYSNKYGTLQFLPDYYEKFTTLNVLFQWSSFYWYLKDRVRYYSEKFQQKKEMTRISYGNEPPKLGQEIYKRNLLNFYYIANKWNIPVLYSTEPLNSITGSFGYSYWNEKIKTVRLPLDSERKEHHEFYNKIIKEVAKSTNAYFIDNDSLFGGDSKYFIDEVHYTKLGIKELAKNYFDYIVSKNIIK